MEGTTSGFGSNDDQKVGRQESDDEQDIGKLDVIGLRRRVWNSRDTGGTFDTNKGWVAVECGCRISYMKQLTWRRNEAMTADGLYTLNDTRLPER